MLRNCKGFGCFVIQSIRRGSSRDLWRGRNVAGCLPSGVQRCIYKGKLTRVGVGSIVVSGVSGIHEYVSESLVIRHTLRQDAPLTNYGT